MPLSPCRYILGNLDSLCSMEPTAKSEVLVLLILFAPIPACLTADRATTSARDADIVTTHEGNNYLTNKFGGVRLLVFLKAAMRQGIYREYQNYRHNDVNLKGTIDIGQHIARNIPFMGNFAYSTREYSHNNNMTELIRHTIEFMKTKKYGQAVLNVDSETIENVNTIIEHTPLYNKSERNSVISKNLRIKTHPYYTDLLLSGKTQKAIKILPEAQ